jgi:hypothetical protein
MPPAPSASGAAARWRGPLRSWPASFRRSRSFGVLSAWLAGTWPVFLRLASYRAAGPIAACPALQQLHRLVRPPSPCVPRQPRASTECPGSRSGATCRRKIATSCRSTRTSTSLAAWLRPSCRRRAADHALVVEPVTHLGLAYDDRVCTDRDAVAVRSSLKAAIEAPERLAGR